MNLHYQIFNQTGRSEKIIIGLHGWTGDEHSLKPLTIGLRERQIEWHLLRAPYRSLPKKGYSWLQQSDDHRTGLEESTQAVHDHISFIVDSGFKTVDIFLLGFSQGAFMALNIALKMRFELGGCIAIAGYLPETYEINRDRLNKNEKKTKFLLLHGENDMIVQPKFSENTHRLLSQSGLDSTFITYPAAHKIHILAINAIRDFILQGSATNIVENK